MWISIIQASSSYFYRFNEKKIVQYIDLDFTAHTAHGRTTRSVCWFRKTLSLVDTERMPSTILSNYETPVEHNESTITYSRIHARIAVTLALRRIDNKYER